ncbi:MAG: AEC family transporter [Bacillota bacterium]|jgi:predicted permease
MDNNIFSQVITLFLLMMVGFIARRVKALDAEMVKCMNKLLINFAAPFIALSAFQFSFSGRMLAEAGTVFLIAVVTNLATIFIGKLLFLRMPDATGRVLRFSAIFTNCAFVGYPVIGGFYGEQGIFLTSIYIVAFNIFVWTYGVFIFTGKADRESLKHALLNPAVVAIFLGLLLFLFSVKLPTPLKLTLEMIGGMTTPLAMIIVGSFLAELKPADLFSGWSVYYGSAVRLVAMPLLTLVCLRLLGINGVVLGVSVLAVAMPVATLTTPLAEQNGGDALFASRLVFISTMLSMVTIPLLALMI